MEAEYLIDPPSPFESLEVQEGFLDDMKKLLEESPNNTNVREIINATEEIIKTLKNK